MISSMKGIIETHCHLDYLKSWPIADVISMAHLAGVEKMVTIAVSPNNQNQVLNIAQKFDHIYCTQGVHPHDAKDWSPQCQEIILNNLKDDNVKAIGEIGLDYHYDNSPRDVQKKVFEAQLQIAIDNDLPIVIHTRDAEADTLAILNNFKFQIKKNLVIHCYTSSKELALFALDHDYFLGFNGIITFKAAQNVRDILHLTPLTNMVIETDAPYLAPIPHRGKENGPQYLPHIAEKMAQEKSVPLDVLLEHLYNNACKLFAIN